MAEFVERNLEGNFYGRKRPDVITNGDNFEAKKREINRKMIESQQGIPMSSVGYFNELMGLQGEADSNIVNNRRGRRTRGKGRKINLNNR